MTLPLRHALLSPATRAVHGLVACMASVGGGGHWANQGLQQIVAALPDIQGAEPGARALLGVVAGVEALAGLRTTPEWSMVAHLDGLLQHGSALPADMPLGGNGPGSASRLLAAGDSTPTGGADARRREILAGGLYAGQSLDHEHAQAALDWLVRCSAEPEWGGFVSAAARPRAWPRSGNPLLPARRVHTGEYDDGTWGDDGPYRASLLHIASDAVAAAWLHPGACTGAAVTRLFEALAPNEAAGVAVAALETCAGVTGQLKRAARRGTTAWPGMQPEALSRCLDGVARFGNVTGTSNIADLGQFIEHAGGAVEGWDSAAWMRAGEGLVQSANRICARLGKHPDVAMRNTNEGLQLYTLLETLAVACRRLVVLVESGRQRARLEHGSHGPQRRRLA